MNRKAQHRRCRSCDQTIARHDPSDPRARLIQRRSEIALGSQRKVHVHGLPGEGVLGTKASPLASWHLRYLNLWIAARSKTEQGRPNDHVRQPFHPDPLSPSTQPNPITTTPDACSSRVQRGADLAPHAVAGSARIPVSKRMLDTTCICVALPLLIPLVALIVVYIKTVSRGPVLYRQQRVGRGETQFELLKFRSMQPDADAQAHESHTTQLLKSDLPLTKMDERGDTRLIPLGRLLRASGLDELPQLLNVLRGEMSIVGPRPCTGYEHALLDHRQKTRFRALPGMTGLWQVSGKNKTTFTQMIDLDAAYVDHWSVTLDLKIMARTLPVLLRQMWEMSKAKRT